LAGNDLFPLFLLFPQGSPILHSFCTTQGQFSIAIDSAFPQSAHSASVRCIEPAGDCGGAGGDRRFSRVNRREGFQDALRCVAGNSGVAASSDSPSFKSWTYAVRLRSHCRSKSADHHLRINFRDQDSRVDCLQSAPETCVPSGTRFCEHTPHRLVRRSDRRGTHEQCGPGGWPGPHLFCSWPRNFQHKSIKKPSRVWECEWMFVCQRPS
jgi:hypothetical protein